MLLGFVWSGWDLLTAEVLSRVDLRAADRDLERTVTQLLVPRVRRAMSGDEPFEVEHGPYEYETAQPPPAQPPQYDIAFVLNANPRVMWPLEAKVLRTGRAVANYVDDVRNQFLVCRYAPFSREGAMLGYLIVGSPDIAFKNIAAAVPCRLIHHTAFPNRSHKFSRHRRTAPRNKQYPRRFCCHHLVFRLRADAQ